MIITDTCFYQCVRAKMNKKLVASSIWDNWPELVNCLPSLLFSADGLLLWTWMWMSSKYARWTFCIGTEEPSAWPASPVCFAPALGKVLEYSCSQVGQPFSVIVFNHANICFCQTKSTSLCCLLFVQGARLGTIQLGYQILFCSTALRVKRSFLQSYSFHLQKGYRASGACLLGQHTTQNLWNS